MFKNPHNNRLALMLIVLIAFVDGILVADHFFVDSPDTVAQEQIALNNDSFEPKTSDESDESTKKVEKKVPFVSQAPLGIWKSPWTKYAEEACVYMAYKWANNENISTEKQASEDMYNIGVWENQIFGSSDLTDAKQTLQILKEHFDYKKATLSYNVSETEIVKLLDQGMIIIMPVDGQLLLNPHYGDPAPKNHMIIIYDYDESSFITNDPGTMYGEAYKYAKTAIINGNSDINGDKVMIVVSR